RGPLALLGSEALLLVHPDPGQLAALAGQLVAHPGVGLLALQQFLAGGLPLLRVDNRVSGHRLLPPCPRAFQAPLPASMTRAWWMLMVLFRNGSQVTVIGPTALSWSRPIQLSCGSMNQAASAKPMSATPSTVPSSGRSWSWTPRARSQATSPTRSSTRQAALVTASAVPVVLLVTTNRLSPPQPKVRNPSSASSSGRPRVSS